MPDDPSAVMRSRRYLCVLVLAAVLGVPISAAAYWFLWAINHGRHLLFETLPTALGLTSVPAWWPLPLLAVGGLLTGAAIRLLTASGQGRRRAQLNCPAFCWRPSPRFALAPWWGLKRP